MQALKGYFSYVRVSTQRQGVSGTSLDEQRDAIGRYARRFSLKITKEFEERETAAKSGRPVFLEMLENLKRGEARGIIIHKIDRSARNLRDWADLGTLIDKGVEVHFANESIDLNSRGGRLSADIQAVVASDYIRNLREETKKGIYGRLKQGLFPFPAPLGYLDAGKGKPKEIDSKTAPLIRRGFELYSQGNMGLDPLADKLYRIGLRNKNNKKVSRNGLVKILKNPFYSGLIKIKRTNEIFVGVHPAIISKELFDEVQDVFAGKRNRKTHKHFFAFRQIITCSFCKNKLIAEKQKGYIYYRCQKKQCPQKHTLREDRIEKKLLKLYRKLQLSDEEYAIFKEAAESYKRDEPKRIAEEKKRLILEESKIKSRLTRLADAYMDMVFDRETYFLKKNEIILKQKEIQEKLQKINEKDSFHLREFEKFLELLKSLYSSYKDAEPVQRREMVKLSVSNLSAEGKSLLIKLEKPFEMMLARPCVPNGSPRRATTRTVLAYLKHFFRNSQKSKNLVNYIFFSY